MAKVKIKPLADRVLVEPMAAETKTASGIIIPDTAKEKPQKGKVVAVGPGTKDEKMTVKEGDTVLYGKYSGPPKKEPHPHASITTKPHAPHHPHDNNYHPHSPQHRKTRLFITASSPLRSNKP